MANGKFNSGKENSFNQKITTTKQMFLAEVVLVDKINRFETDPIIKTIDLIYNSDPYVIKCRIVGDDYDNVITDNIDLPNCTPLLPRFNNVRPKVGEMVIVFIFGENDKYTDRFYIGPIISDPTKLDKQTTLEGSMNNLTTSLFTAKQDISNIESVKGIYPEYDNEDTITLYGRNNTDIVFKDSEILLRAGKFVEGDPRTFNQKNPAYIQIKNGFNIQEGDDNKTVSVNNVVANKINLLTYEGGDPLFNLTQRDLASNQTPYITDEEMTNILANAHPMVYGDIVLEYLIAFKNAFYAHVHNKLGSSNPTDNTTQSNAVEYFKNVAPKLELAMLSKNIKLN
jgi:hypothetical protein